MYARLIIALLIAVTFGLGGARATSITPGTLNLSFQNGEGTATGYFIYNPATNQLTSWNFQLSASSDGFFAASTYNSADVANNAAGAIALPNSNGDQVFSFEENQPGQNQRNEFDIVLSCNGVANCVANAAVGTTFAIAVQPVPCAAGALKCIPSGEQTNVPNFGLQRNLAAGFITVTDPNGLLAFNLDPTGNGGGGGTPPPVPEPSTVVLLGAGVGVLAILKLRS
jgi:hypothetical protein